LHSAAGLCPDPLGELTALPRPLALSKEGIEGQEMKMKEKWKGGNQAEKREIKGKGG